MNPGKPRFNVYSMNWSNHCQIRKRSIYHRDGLESKRNSVGQRWKTAPMNQEHFEEKNLTRSSYRCYTILPATTIGKTFPTDVITLSEGLME
jgi:hypothetical protein